MNTNLSEIINQHDLIERVVENRTQAVAALKNKRGEANGAIRIVKIQPRASLDRLDVHGPADGRPLIIENRRGFQTYAVHSGNVVVIADSAFGNSINVADGAHVTVIAYRDVKVSASVEGHGTLIVDTFSRSHGLIHTNSEDATIEILGDAHNHTLSTPATRRVRGY